MITTLFKEAIAIIKELAGHDTLYFVSAVQVKLSPHTHPFHAWGVCVSPSDELYVMDSSEEWHQLELADMNAAQMISSLYQRLKWMRFQVNYAKAS